MTIIFQRGGGGRGKKPEAEFQSAVVKFLEHRFGPRFWYINHLGGLGQRAGIPDLLCCVDGRFLALEIKSPTGTGRLGPSQKLELEAIRRAGGVAGVVASWDELEALLEEVERSTTPA